MREIVERYFQSWIDRDSSVISDYFSDHVIYSECYGPEYANKKQCLKWFDDWNKKGSVLEWRIKGILEIDNTCLVEWYFRCDYEGETEGFDGVSLITFENGKITVVKEFQSRAEHYNPYEGLV